MGEILVTCLLFSLLLYYYIYKNIVYSNYSVYLQQNKTIMTKVIHVHLLQGRKNYYFGSIPAIYSVLAAEDIGIKQCSLERVGLSKGGVVLNKKACIMSGKLIRSKATKKR